MKLSKLKAWVGVLVLASALSARADINVIWTTDTSSAFDFTVSGTGGYGLNPTSSGFHTNTMISPSGLWQFDGAASGRYDVAGFSEPVITLSGGGLMTFLGVVNTDLFPTIPQSPTLEAGGYNDHFPQTDTTAHSEQIWTDGNLRAGFPVGLGWDGSTTLDITVIPDVTDPTTWSWSAHYFASGPDVTAVPEPGTLAFGLAGLVLLAARKGSWLTDKRTT